MSDTAQPPSFLPKGALLALVLLGITGFAILRGEVTLAVRHETVPVIDVRTVPGADLAHRLVLVQVGDRTRALRTQDRLLIVRPGGRVCLRHRTVLLRRWEYPSLVLPGYCGPALPPAGSGQRMVAPPKV